MLGFRVQDWLAEPGLFFRLVHEEERDRVREEVADNERRCRSTPSTG